MMNQIKVIRKTFVGVVAAVLLMGTVVIATPTDVFAKSKVKVKSIVVTSLSGKTVYVAKGKKVPLTTTVKVTPNKEANRAVTYRSSNRRIAYVTSSGKVKGKKAGKTTITVSSLKNPKKKKKIKVVVKKKSIKKITFKKKIFSLAPGKSMSLKATISPSKNVSKILRWSSANKKIVSVSAKGVVTAKKAGSATITVKATDGSGKSASCRVEVSEAAGQKQETTSEDKTGETQEKELPASFAEEKLSSWTEGSYGEDNLSFFGADYSTYTITALPDGLSSKKSEKEGLVVYGTPTKSGVTEAVIKATDSKGNTYTETVWFLVGSPEKIVGAGLPVYVLEAENDTEQNVSAAVRFEGGSGKYALSVTDDGGIGASLAENNGTAGDDLTLTANVQKAGTYTVKVAATDLEKDSLTAEATVVIHVAKAITVSGTVTDAGGNGMPYDSVTFTNADRGDRYTPTASVLSGERSGKYQIRVATGTYRVTAAYNRDKSNNGAEVTLSEQKYSAAVSRVNLKLPLYKVTLTSSDETFFPALHSWQILRGESVAVYEKSGDAHTGELYLRAGTYALQSGDFYENEKCTNSDDSPLNWFYGYTATTRRDTCRYAANFTVKNTAVSQQVTKLLIQKGDVVNSVVFPGVKNTEATVNIGEMATISEEENIYGYQFIPPESGGYTIDNSLISLYDEEGSLIVAGDDGSYFLTEDVTYYVAQGPSVTTTSFTINKKA